MRKKTRGKIGHFDEYFYPIGTTFLADGEKCRCTKTQGDSYAVSYYKVLERGSTDKRGLTSQANLATRNTLRCIT